MCVGACGPMSSNANTSPSSYTIFDGIFFAAILQNRQSALIQSSCDRAFIQANHPRRKTFPVAKLLPELVSGELAVHFAHAQAVQHAVTRVTVLNAAGRVRSHQ